MKSQYTLIAQIFLGCFCLLFGLNKFFGFIVFPALPGDGGTLMKIYAHSGFLKIIGGIEILGGLLLIFGKFVPLSLVFMSAIFINATWFHYTYSKQHIAGALIGLVLTLVLMIIYRKKYSGLLSM